MWKRKWKLVWGGQPARFSPGFTVASADCPDLANVKVTSQRLLASGRGQVNGIASALWPHARSSSLDAAGWYLVLKHRSRIQTDSTWILWLIFRGKDHTETGILAPQKQHGTWSLSHLGSSSDSLT